MFTPRIFDGYQGIMLVYERQRSEYPGRTDATGRT